MEIYTSFFDNWRYMKARRMTVVSVTNRKPMAFSDMPVLTSLAPTIECYNAPQGKFLETYWRTVLFKSNPWSVFKLLRTISMMNDDSDIAICDFNPPSEFNYRRQIAKWLMNANHVRILELDSMAKPEDLKIDEIDTEAAKEAKRRILLQNDLGEKPVSENPFPDWMPPFP